MTTFWIYCAAIMLAAIPFIVLPLWRSSASSNDVLRDATNLGILRDQSSELEADLRNGLLTQEAYEQGKRELETRLLEEVKNPNKPSNATHNPAKILAIVLAVLLPLFSIPLYMKLGNIDALEPQEPIVADESGVVRSPEALQSLEKRVKRVGKNPNDWWMLARTYTEMKRYTEALEAYDRLIALVPNEAQLWANSADVYAMGHGQSLQSDEVAKRLNKALELDPVNTMALALSGSAAMERNDYVTAISRWQDLVSQMEQQDPSSPDIDVYRGGIKQAAVMLGAQPGGKEKLAQMAAAKASALAAKQAASITGKVSLSPALAAKAAPTDTVFVLARAAAQGPKMPLAVLRKQVKDLPFSFSLDDSMAMQPQLKLSGFQQVVVVARVSKSGTPMAQPGDLQGLSSTVKPGAKDLNIVIDTVSQ